jgi:hypothetical protein
MVDSFSLRPDDTDTLSSVLGSGAIIFTYTDADILCTHKKKPLNNKVRVKVKVKVKVKAAFDAFQSCRLYHRVLFFCYFLFLIIFVSMIFK